MQRGKTPPTSVQWFSLLGLQNTSLNECPGYDTKQSDGQAPVMLELMGMWSAPSLPSLPGQFRPGVVAPDRVLSIGRI